MTRPLAGPRARGQDRDRRGHVWHADCLDSLLQNEILPFLPRDIARLLPRIVTALQFTETHLPTFHGLLGHTRHACGVCKCKLTMTRPRRSPLCTSLRLLVNLASLLNRVFKNHSDRLSTGEHTPAGAVSQSLPRVSPESPRAPHRPATRRHRDCETVSLLSTVCDYTNSNERLWGQTPAHNCESCRRINSQKRRLCRPPHTPPQAGGPRAQQPGGPSDGEPRSQRWPCVSSMTSAV